MLDKELGVGPFDLNIADLGWDERIQDKLDIINDALLGLFILYVLSMGFTGLTVIGCLIAIVLVDSRIVALGGLITSALATTCLVIASILITVVMTKGVNEMNDLADRIGVHVERGDNFLIITWVAAGVMIAPMIFWAVRFCGMRREKQRFKSYKGSH
jgi:SUR7/PalI family